jgi:hypothetical protein
MSRWYYTPDNRQRLGPVTSEELRRLALSGVIRPECMVTREGSGKWTPAAKFKGLFPEAAPSLPGTVTVQCPRCRRDIALQAHELSQTFECARCGTHFVPSQIAPLPVAVAVPIIPTAKPVSAVPPMASSVPPRALPVEPPPSALPVVPPRWNWTNRKALIVLAVAGAAGAAVFGIVLMGILIAFGGTQASLPTNEPSLAAWMEAERAYRAAHPPRYFIGSLLEYRNRAIEAMGTKPRTQRFTVKAALLDGGSKMRVEDRSMSLLAGVDSNWLLGKDSGTGVFGDGRSHVVLADLSYVDENNIWVVLPIHPK